MITDRIGLLSVLLPLLTARAARIFCMFLGLHPWDLLIIPKWALVHTAFDVYYLITVSTKKGCMMQVKKKKSTGYETLAAITFSEVYFA